MTIHTTAPKGIELDEAIKGRLGEYVHVTIVDTTDRKADISDKVIFSYDLPRWLYFQRSWVINWRMAKEQCRTPKAHLAYCLSFYYPNKEAENVRIQNKLTATKRTITKVEKALDYIINEAGKTLYKDSYKTDELYLKGLLKLKNLTYKIKELENEIKGS